MYITVKGKDVIPEKWVTPEQYYDLRNDTGLMECFSNSDKDMVALYIDKDKKIWKIKIVRSS